MASSSYPNSSLHLFLFCLIFCMILNLVTSTSDENPFTYIDCSADSNFTLDSTYQSNLNYVLSALPSNLNYVLSALPSAGSPTGFTIAAYGNAPEQVYGWATCRADQSPSQCQSCLVTAAQGITIRCAVGKRAMIFYDKCFLRYADSNSTTTKEKSWGEILYNEGTISDVQAFDNLYNDLMGGLAAKAANSSRKFEMGQANFTSDITMYGLTQCMSDISADECRTCLNQSMVYFHNCCNKNQGGVVLRYGCYIRMEIYPFLENSSTERPSSPPLSMLSPAPQPVPDSSIGPPSEKNTSKFVDNEKGHVNLQPNKLIPYCIL